MHGVAQRRQRGLDRLDVGALVDDLLAVAVAVDREQHRRLDLREAVDDRAGAELGRARRPHRAQARGGEERDDRLGDVGQVRGDAIAALHTEAHEPGATARDAVGEVRPRDLRRRPGLAVRHDRHLVSTAGVVVVDGGERVLGVVERAPREPLRARHRPPSEPARGLVVPADPRPLRTRAPEPVEVVDRPLPQLGVPVEVQVAGVGEPVEERADATGRPHVGRRGPDDLAARLRHRALPSFVLPSPTSFG